jgi:hypothetical protein
MRTDPILWERINKYTPDDPDANFAFSDRLARENGWSKAYARRVIEEYKRFLYLAVVAGREVTPSEAVDQAWHLHLVYTRSYWDDLCANVLRRPLHHGPTKGGAREDDRYEDNYEATKARYVAEFAVAPPDDIWPSAEERFRHAGRWRFIDTSRYWLVPALRWPFSFRQGKAIAFVAAFSSVVFTSSSAMSDNSGSKAVPIAMLMLMVGVFVALAVVAGSASEDERRKKKDNSGGCGSAGSSGCGSGSSSGCGGGGCGGGGCS